LDLTADQEAALAGLVARAMMALELSGQPAMQAEEEARND